jgi:hypothetical protein
VNTRLLCLCLLPFAAGCVEDLKAEEKAKPAATVRADPPPGDAPKAEKKPAAELPDLPTGDPLVADAVQAREQISRLEEEILDRLDDLRSALAQAKADPAKLRESVERFVEVTRDVRAKTALAGGAITGLTDKTAELSRSSRHLAGSYRALADLYRRKARDYSEKPLQDRLLAFAADYDAVAKSLPERVKALDGVRKSLPALNRKVAEVNAFLGDAVAFLTTHPGIGADARERYVAEFESFAVTVSEWLRVLDDLRAALRSKAVSKAIRESYQREVLVAAQIEATKRAEQERADRLRQDELARAEQARQARLAAEEDERIARERERRTEAAAVTPVPATVVPPAPVASWPVTVRYQPVIYCGPSRPQRVVYRAACPTPVYQVVHRCP